MKDRITKLLGTIFEVMFQRKNLNMKAKNFLHFIALIFILASFLSCNRKSSDKESNSIETVGQNESATFFTINFAEIIKHKTEVPLSEIAGNVEIIQFENTRESLLGNILDVQLSKDYIFVKHSGSRLLTQFNRDGKFIRHIGSEGRGPKEYALMRDFSLDRKNKLIYIHTNWTRKISRV